MIKAAIIFFCLTLIFFRCKDRTATDKAIGPEITIIKDITTFKGLHGTWIRQNKYGCTFIEIKDTASILYYQFIDHKAE